MDMTSDIWHLTSLRALSTFESLEIIASECTVTAGDFTPEVGLPLRKEGWVLFR